MNIHDHSTTAARQARRRFLKGMGLSAAAAPLVLGIGDSLLGRALGQATSRKLALFFVHGEAWNGGDWAASYTPPGAGDLSFQGSNSDREPVAGQEVDETGMAWPPFVKALAEWKDRMVLVDGLPFYGISSIIPVWPTGSETRR
ncbi:MAG: hypothetical protein RJA70_2849 [Pseudomonadota bacterium]|jgi:hypothetical protein